MNAPKRPGRHDDAVVQRAAELLYEELPDEFKGEPGQRETTLTSLADVLDDHSDGYAIAQALERHHGWRPDAELVELLDGTWLSDAHEELVEAWIEQWDRKPRLEAGAAVRVEAWDKDMKARAMYDGVICKLEPWNMRDGTYTVKIDALGHVDPPPMDAPWGDPRFGKPLGVNLPWEDVEKTTGLPDEEFRLVPQG